MQAKPLVSVVGSAAPQSGEQLFDAYHEVLSGMEQGIIFWSEDRVCHFVNKRFFEITGASELELFPGQSWEDYMENLRKQGRYSKEDVDSLRELMKSKEKFTHERESNSGLYITLTIRPLVSGGHVVSLTDITQLKRHEESLAAALKRAEGAEIEAQKALAVRRLRQAETDKLSEFGDWLHSCKSLAELYEVVSQAMQSIYQGSAGQLYIYSNSRDVLDGVCTWGDCELQPSIQAQDCWSLRRGRLFQFGDSMIKLNCNHVDQTERNVSSYYCLPLIAHGDTIGLLHLDLSNIDSNASGAFTGDLNLAFIKKCAEQVSLAVANAQLRDELHEQSTLDPLTGLFNRRYFMERFRSEISRAEKSGTQVGVAMFDADNFKHFNDSHGHDAGDAVLMHISNLAHRFFVSDELVARIGGEEFAILSPDSTVDGFAERLESFKQLISQMNIRHFNNTLPNVSVSIGFAMYPNHSHKVSELIKLADQAMYKSKESGKNQVQQATL